MMMNRYLFYGVLAACLVLAAFSMFLMDDIKTAWRQDKADSYYKANDFGEAGIYYEQAYSSNRSAIAAYNTGNALYQQGRYKAALQWYKRGVSDTEKHQLAALYNNMGNAYYKIGDLTASASSYKKALLLNPDDSNVRNDLLFVLNKLAMQRAARGNDKKSPNDAEVQNQQNNHSNEQGEKTDGPSPDVTAKEVESLLDMVAQSEELKKGKTSNMKKAPGRLAPGEKDY